MRACNGYCICTGVVLSMYSQCGGDLTFWSLRCDVSGVQAKSEMEATTKDHLPPRVGATVSISIQHFTHQSLLGYHAIWIENTGAVNMLVSIFSRTTNHQRDQLSSGVY